MIKRRTNGSRARRRNYLINPAFQWKYTLAIGTGVFVVATLMGVALFGSLHHQARAKYLFPSTSDPWQNARTIVFFAVTFSTVMVATFGCWIILVTHRISGPMFVLEHHLSRLSQGRFPKRRPLRAKDEFKEIHEAFWRAVDFLKAARQAELDTLTEVLDTAKSATKRGSEAQCDALRSITTRIEPLRNEIAEALDQAADSRPARPRTGKTSRKAEAFAMAGSNV